MLREVLARFGIDVDSSQLLTGLSSLRNLAQAAYQAARVLVDQFAAAVTAVTTEMASFGDEVAKSARRLGLGADELNAWRFAAERSGVSTSELTTGLQRLQRNIVDAGEGSETSLRAFRDLGISARDGAGNFREIEDLLPDIADAFAGLDNDTQRAARAQQLFGRSGQALLPLFENGAAGIEELQARFAELGGVLGQDFFENAEAAQDALADWEVASRSIKAVLATELLPAFTALVSGASDILGALNQFNQETTLIRSAVIALSLALGALAVVIGVALTPVLLAVLAAASPLIVVFVGLGLAIDELITFIDGGDSALGRLLDTMFGAGAAAQVAKELKIAWADFAQTASEFITEDLIPALRSFGATVVDLWPTVRAVLQGIGSAIMAVVEAAQTMARVLSGDQDFLDSSLFTGAANLLGVGGNQDQPSEGQRVRARIRDEVRSANINQTNRIEINGTNLSPEELQRQVTAALERNSETALRDADRALTAVVG